MPRYPYTAAQLAQVLRAREARLTNLDRLAYAMHIGAVWRAVRSVFFEPSRTLERGYPWEDVA